MLVLFGLLFWRQAVAAIGKGTDVYLFLIGMMLLSEVALPIANPANLVVFGAQLPALSERLRWGLRMARCRPEG